MGPSGGASTSTGGHAGTSKDRTSFSPVHHSRNQSVYNTQKNSQLSHISANTMVGQNHHAAPGMYAQHSLVSTGNSILQSHGTHTGGSMQTSAAEMQQL